MIFYLKSRILIILFIVILFEYEVDKPDSRQCNISEVAVRITDYFSVQLFKEVDLRYDKSGIDSCFRLFGKHLNPFLWVKFCYRQHLLLCGALTGFVFLVSDDGLCQAPGAVPVL